MSDAIKNVFALVIVMGCFACAMGWVFFRIAILLERVIW